MVGAYISVTRGKASHSLKSSCPAILQITISPSPYPHIHRLAHHLRDGDSLLMSQRSQLLHLTFGKLNLGSYHDGIILHHDIIAIDP
jgi:hypothetical protein